ncbi:MAG TPA: hypothetical protein VGG57_15800 [Stellaceae bacterium]|jgi:hypothetical protein
MRLDLSSCRRDADAFEGDSEFGVEHADAVGALAAAQDQRPLRTS